MGDCKLANGGAFSFSGTLPEFAGQAFQPDTDDRVRLESLTYKAAPPFMGQPNGKSLATGFALD
jgi:hypothetical protein